jgi:hypothetical protein
MTPGRIGGADITVHSVDEYVHCDTAYFDLLRGSRNNPTLVAFVGTQSHQFHRAADLAALARSDGYMAVIGGPHPMTCQTTELQHGGVSFARLKQKPFGPPFCAMQLRVSCNRPMAQTSGGQANWIHRLSYHRRYPS